jgi:SH3-like domain-containing protein
MAGASRMNATCLRQQGISGLMASRRAAKGRLASIFVAVACLAVSAGVAYSLLASKESSHASAFIADGSETTGSISEGPRTLGPSGLPIPRFVSLKAEKVNVRRGPSSDHPVAWVFQRKGMPVEIVAEFENWRRIRDSDGSEGWILQNLLAGKRTAVVAPWRKGETLPLHASADAGSSVVAKLGVGVVSDVVTCTGDWCEVTVDGYDGWIEQASLWGVYPGEKVD